MAGILQHRRAATAVVASVTPLGGELLENTDDAGIRLGDGSVLGGWIVGGHPITSVTSSPYTVLTSDQGHLIVFNSGSAIAVTVPQAGVTRNYPNGARFYVLNLGAGLVTLTPTTSQINSASTLTFATNENGMVTSDGANYWAIKSSIAAAGSFATLTDVTLTSLASNDFVAYNSGSSKWTNRTHTAATALLDVMVGDSGSGGTKGLVTAPGAGDAAALKFLKADATWAVPSGTGASGAIVFISTKTASGSGTLTWTGISGFNKYRLVGSFLVPATDTANLIIRLGSGGGPTYGTGWLWSNYVSGASGNSGTQNPPTTSARVAFNVHNTVPGVSFDLLITTDGTDAQINGTAGYTLSATSYDTAMFAGLVSLGASLTAIELSFSTGNITSGTASLYSQAD